MSSTRLLGALLRCTLAAFCAGEILAAVGVALADEPRTLPSVPPPAAGSSAAPGSGIPPAATPAPSGSPGAARLGFEELSSPSGPEIQILPIDLPTALRLANASNPTIAVAQVRVREAYDSLRAARALFLPNLQGVTAYGRHDGRIQRAEGSVFTSSWQNAFLGGGAVLSWPTGEVLFAPLIARRLLDAQAFDARAVTDHIQLDVALTYLDLLQVYGALAVNAETLAKAEQMLRLAVAAERNGLGKTPADAKRARTEVDLRRLERTDLEGQAAVVSARLAQLLLLEPTVDLRPADPTVLPITLVPLDVPLQQLVSTALMNRPELAGSRALVAAAQARWRQARLTPLLPQLNVSYNAGDFGGGIHDELGSWGGRGDGTAQAVWTLHNLGAGDVARARIQREEYNVANLRVAELQAQVGAEVTAAAKQARSRQRNLETAQDAVLQAEEMWRRLSAGAFGINGPARQYDPLEPLLAEQALNQARVQYLTEVIEYDRAQFRLYTAMGQPPLLALPTATAIPTSVPVRPGPGSTTQKLPPLRGVEQPPR